MTEETGDVRFGRSAFGGFNRRDVIEYIDRLQRSAAARDGSQALEQLGRERDELERENRRLREENAQLRAQLQVGKTADEPREAVSEEAFSATVEPASDGDPRSLSLRDVDEMVQKYFG